MAIPEEAQSQWYQALFEQDCLMVMELLETYPILVKVGWKEEPSRVVKGSPKEHWKKSESSTWKGRTALHVGAKRRCVKLIEQVLTICKVDLSDVIPLLFDQTNVAPTEGANTNSKNVAGFSQDGVAAEDDQQSAEAGQKTGSPGGSLGMGLQEDASAEVNPTELTFAGSERNLTVREDSSLQKSVSVSDSRKPSLRAPAGDATVSRAELQQLLDRKDREYKLDALAIATLHGDVDHFVLLVHAMSKGEQFRIKRNIYTLGKEWKARVKVKPDEAQRAKLRQATQEVIARFSHESPNFRQWCLDEYDKHRDFNFLERDEYLFHFLFTYRFSSSYRNLRDPATASDCNVMRKDVRKALWGKVKSVRSDGKELWRFLLKLQDGQGRPPFHVAIMDPFPKCGQVDDFISLTKKDKVIVLCTMTTCDAAGRSPVYRAAATGNTRALKLCGIYEEVQKHFNEPWRQLACKLMNSDCCKSTNANSFCSSLSRSNGFRFGVHKGCTPNRAAIILKHPIRRKPDGPDLYKSYWTDRAGLEPSYAWTPLDWPDYKLDSECFLVGDKETVNAIGQAIQACIEAQCRRSKIDDSEPMTGRVYRWKAIHMLPILQIITS